MTPLATDKDFETIMSFDDLTVVSNDLSESRAFTLTSVVRNEMFFLPAFLEHYRSIGVRRFVFLDDHSDDGTRDYLAKQSDCMVVESQRRFSQWVEIDHPMRRKNGTARVREIWINLLFQKFALDRWSIHVDADEFLRIPETMDLPTICDQFDQSGATAICGVMLDLYPAEIGDLIRMKDDKSLRDDAIWYYDARKHLSLPGPVRRNGWSRPSVQYEGARARLMHEFEIRKQRGFKRIKSLYRVPGYNPIRKIQLMRFQRQSYFIHSHWINTPVSSKYVLPIEHYKFSGQLYGRTEAAVATKSHYNGSIEYRDIAVLLQKMTDADASFLCPWSSADRTFAAYSRNQVALGF